LRGTRARSLVAARPRRSSCRAFVERSSASPDRFSTDDFRNIVPRFSPEARKANQPWIVPIPGTTKLHRLKENVGGADVTLTSDELRHIGDALASIKVEGARCPAHLTARVGK
jgi:hypothetical protein